MNQFKRIIIVDDDNLVIMICSHIIKKYVPNAEIVAFTSPEKVIPYLEAQYTNTPVETIMFLDINMPIMSGWDVLNGLNKIKYQMTTWVAVYMFSSSVIYEDRQLSNRHPMVTDFVEKPLTIEKLTQLITQGVSKVPLIS